MPTEGQGKSFIHSLTHSHRPQALQMAQGSPVRPGEKGCNLDGELLGKLGVSVVLGGKQ